VFQGFCQREGRGWFPAEPLTIRAFIEDCVRVGKKPATIRRYIATIARAHRAAGLVSPCASEPVRLAIKKMSRETTARQRQAKALGWEDIKRFIQTAGEGLRADRERALLCVAYDTLARRSELVALDVEDLAFSEDGSGRALIRRSKTDAESQGAVGYLAPVTAIHLKRWMRAAGITEGALFRRLIGRSRVGERLHPDMVADIFKRVSKWIGWAPEQVAQVSGHSIRVGATQDLLALNIDLAAVMQAGRWVTTVMPMRYGEHILAGRAAMARAAREQGRT
jgi:integrase